MANVFIPHHAADDIAIADTITNPDRYFPDVRLADFRRSMRVDDIASDARTAWQITTAMLFVNAETESWRARQTADVLPPGSATACYRLAIYHRAKAYLIEQYRDVDTTKSGHDRAEEMEIRIKVYLQRSREALRQLIGTPRMTVELL